VALSARFRGIPAYVVMPRTASEIKKAAVRGYGGTITESEATQESREAVLADIAHETGATVISPYDDYRVIAGQGTVALELLEDLPDLDAIIAPVSGGGLLAGVCVTTAAVTLRTRVIGAEPEGDDDAYRSLQAGHVLPPIHPRTIADGLLGCALGALNFPIIRRVVSGIVTVSEAAIEQATRLIWERTKLLIEPSGAITLGVLLEKKVDLSGQRVGLIFSGGNVNLDKLPWLGH
jgi:threonine dehydratase